MPSQQLDIASWIMRSGDAAQISFEKLNLRTVQGFSPLFMIQYLQAFCENNEHIEVGIKKGRGSGRVLAAQAKNLRKAREAIEGALTVKRAHSLFDNLSSVAARHNVPELLSESKKQQFIEALSSLEAIAADCDSFAQLLGSQSDERLAEAMKTRYLVALHSHLKCIGRTHPYPALSKLLKAVGHNISPGALRSRINYFSERDPKSTERYKGIGERAKIDGIDTKDYCINGKQRRADSIAAEIISYRVTPI